MPSILSLRLPDKAHRALPLRQALAAMDTPSPTEAYVAFEIGYFREVDVLDWAETYARERPDLQPESPVLELFWLNRKRPDRLLRVAELLTMFIGQIAPEFDVRSQAAEENARSMFELRLEEYLAEKCRPWDVCRMVSSIEQLFDFPDWLGSMYDNCDWIDPETRPVDCRYLEHAIREHLDRV